MKKEMEESVVNYKSHNLQINMERKNRNKILRILVIIRKDK